MPLQILYPDAQFDGEPTAEAKVFGPRASLSVYRPRETATITEAIWRACDAIVCYHDVDIGQSIVGMLDRCRLIVRAGVGYDQIDIAACAARGIPVCNTPDYGTTDVADHAIGLMLALARGIVAYNTGLKEDIGIGWNFNAAPTVRRLSGQVLGIVGLGRIGTATALRAKALGMRVVFFDPYRPTGTELALGLARVHSLEALLGAADVVSLHTPLSDETRAMIDSAAVARMKPGTLLVNTSGVRSWIPMPCSKGFVRASSRVRRSTCCRSSRRWAAKRCSWHGGTTIRPWPINSSSRPMRPSTASPAWPICGANRPRPRSTTSMRAGCGIA